VPPGSAGGDWREHAHRAHARNVCMHGARLLSSNSISRRWTHTSMQPPSFSLPGASRKDDTYVRSVGKGNESPRLRCVECRSRGDDRSKVYEDINLKAAVAASCTYHTLLAPFLYVATRCSLTAAVATWRKRETEVMYAREGLQQRRQ
jgi:hypothetical protein